MAPGLSNDSSNPRAFRPGGSVVMTPLKSVPGFTLIELVMVLAIIAVLSAIAVPRFGDATQRRRLEAAEKRILADIDHARELARARSAPVTMAFDSVNDVYAIASARNPLTRVTTHYTVELGDAPYRIDLGIINLGGDSLLIHDGFGQPDSGGTIQISSGGLSTTITIDAP